MKKAIYTIIALLALSTVTHAQNVGVNTDGSDPDGDALLHVNRTTGVAIDSALIRIENEDNASANNVTGLEFLNSATGATSRWSLYNPGGGSTDFRFNNNGTDYVTVKESGYVGIGTTTPDYLFHIQDNGDLGTLNVYVDAVVKGLNPRFMLQDVNASTLNNAMYLLSDDNSNVTGAFGFGDVETGFTGNVLKIETGEPSTASDGAPITFNPDNEEVMRVDTSGNVGIGTTTPSPNHLLSMFSSRATVGEVIGVKMSNANSVDLEIGVTGAAYIGVGQSNAGLINVVDLQPLIFGTNNTERMRISQNGNVGIGTSTPSTLLQIVGGSLSFDTDDDNDWAGISELNGGLALSGKLNATAFPNLFIQQGGNVGIGTTTPNSILNTANTYTSDDEYTNMISMEYTNTGFWDWAIGPTVRAGNTNFDIRGGADGIANISPFVTITGDNGNFGIGTTTPGSKLHINDPTSSTSEVLRLENGAGAYSFKIHDDFRLATVGSNAADYGGNGYNSVLVMNQAGAGHFVFGDHIGPWSDGFYDIGSTFARWRSIHLVNTPVVTSDARCKSKIKTVPYGLETVMKMNPVIYNKYADFAKTGDYVLETGFLAQELKNLVPNAVEGNPEGENPMGVRYNHLIPVLTKALQEQQAIIEELKKENTELKAEASTSSAATNQRLEDLEAKINALLNAQAVTVQK